MEDEENASQRKRDRETLRLGEKEIEQLGDFKTGRLCEFGNWHLIGI